MSTINNAESNELMRELLSVASMIIGSVLKQMKRFVIPPATTHLGINFTSFNNSISEENSPFSF